MDREAWQTTVPGVTMSLDDDEHTHACNIKYKTHTEKYAYFNLNNIIVCGAEAKDVI